MRRALADTLTNMAREDDSIVLLTADLGFQVFDEFRAEFPDRYVNVGIAEQTLVDMAAGLSSRGFKPFVYSIASFMTARAYEQIKLSLGYNSQPVVVIGGGGGLTYSRSGATHHALDDFALMLNIPGMTVCAPHGPNELSQCLWLLAGRSGGAYIRIEKFGEPDLLPLDGVQLGSPIRAAGTDDAPIVVLTTGTMLASCLDARRLSSRPAAVAVVHTPFLRPLDVTKWRQQFRKASFIVVADEHYPIGGLYDVIVQLCFEIEWHGTIKRVGPEQEFVHETANLDQLRSLVGLGTENVIATIQECLESQA